jgi:hypothetical protein
VIVCSSTSADRPTTTVRMTSTTAIMNRSSGPAAAHSACQLRSPGSWSRISTIRPTK